MVADKSSRTDILQAYTAFTRSDVSLFLSLLIHRSRVCLRELLDYPPSPFNDWILNAILNDALASANPATSHEGLSH